MRHELKTKNEAIISLIYCMTFTSHKEECISSVCEYLKLNESQRRKLEILMNNYDINKKGINHFQKCIMKIVTEIVTD